MWKPRHIKTEALERATYWVAIIGFPLLVISTGLGLYQLREVRRIASSQNNIALNSEFLNGANSAVINAIENKRPILKEHGGRFNSTELDNYLGDFETINLAFREGLLSEGELCTSFSYYVGITMKNGEIKKYLTENFDYFGGLTDLYKIINESKNSDCH